VLSNQFQLIGETPWIKGFLNRENQKQFLYIFYLPLLFNPFGTAVSNQATNRNLRRYAMKIINKNIDSGTPFDWGKTSLDYAKFRNIYPKEFYQKIIDRGLCMNGQSVLDIGTGTGVLPRNMYEYGAKWTATDISVEQIDQAKILSKGMDINYYAVSTENIKFPNNSFDVITACQCFWYFDHETVMPKFYRMLKIGGSILILYMAWLPFEDKIANASENLVLKYNPNWNGAGETIHQITIPDCYKEKFELVYYEEFTVKVPFTRDSWNGRMKTCRGIGASLTNKEISMWEQEHRKLLEDIAPNEFDVLHYGAISELRKKGVYYGHRNHFKAEGNTSS